MKGRPAPLLFILGALAVGMLLALVAIFIAINQPWLGLRLSPNDAGGLRVTAVAQDGPSTAIQLESVLTAIDDGEGRAVVLDPFDLVEDPDTASSYAAMDNFLVRQGAIAEILRADRVYLTLSDGTRVEVIPALRRPLGHLPGVFWLLLFIGLACTVIGAWTWSVRPHEAGVRAFFLGSVALLLSTFGSALFISRELALDGGLFRVLSSLNLLGSLSFVVAMFVLFLVYPRRLAPSWVAATIAAIVAILWIADVFRIGFSSPAYGRYLTTIVVVCGALGAAGVQYWRAAGEPLMRAGLIWFGLSIAVCAVFFFAMFVVPSLLGQNPVLPQGFGYALAVPVYAGMAVGVVRYRLFDLEGWAFRILFYAAGAVALVCLDVVLISVAAMDRLPAFSLSLLAVALLYLPLRDTLARRLMPAPANRGALFHKVVDAALSASVAERNERWGRLLRDAFNPLWADVAANRLKPEIADDGLALTIPGAGGAAPVKLGYANGGRRLFTRRDVELAGELCAMLRHASESRDAYEKGAAEERARIARDMHDNIGAKLLSALHSPLPDRKDAMVRETLTDLRNILNNLTGTTESLDEALGDLRLETAERLAAAGLTLKWQVVDTEGDAVLPVAVHTLRSILREAVSNTIRHSRAKEMTIEIGRKDGRLTLTVSDDGQGLSVDANSSGIGLAGIRSRLKALRGTLDVINTGPGLRLVAEFSCDGGTRS